MWSRFPSVLIIVAALLFGAVLPARAQNDAGPMAPPPKFEAHTLSAIPHPPPPPMPAADIIQKLAANEDEMKKLYADYNFTETIQVREFANPGGQFTATGESYRKPDGERYWRILKPPQSTLKVLDLSLEDLRTIVSVPLFYLTTDEIGNYDFLYAGKDKLDQIDTYVFQVKPKVLSRTHRYFQGAIWVDTETLTIVKTYGQFVSEIFNNGKEFPFTMFETYRENFKDKYWIPTYMDSDDYINEPDGSQLHARLVVRSSDFKLNTGAPEPSPQTGASPAAAPAAPPPPAPQQMK